MILPWYSQLFTLDEILTAEDRLALMDFDIATYLGAAEEPDWSNG